MIDSMINKLTKTMVKKKEELITSKLDLLTGNNWDINKVNRLLIDRVEIFSYNGEEFLEIFPLQSTMANNRLEAMFHYRYLPC